MSRAARVENILSAAHLIDPLFLNTAIVEEPALRAVLGCSVVAKIEIDNPIGSFKGRGAEFFAATQLRPNEAIVCASAGNFGQGLARAALRRGHACLVFAAETANPLKIDAMRRLGAEVRIAGADFDGAKDAARNDADLSGRRYVEDGAEPAIAEGAGTIGLELAAAAAFDTIVVQLGNGALLSGVGTALRHASPEVEIIAVVAENAPAMKLSLEAGRAIETAAANTMADGIAVRVPIEDSPAFLSGCWNTVVAVSERDIFKAMALVHRCLGLTVEPAGAAGLAAVAADPSRFKGRRVAIILCGGNISAEMRDLVLRDAQERHAQ